MAYNLRPRRICEELLEDDADTNVDVLSENECEFSSANDSSSDSSNTDEINDSDFENATLDKRILESRFRGRPSTKLRGKNNFLWDTRCPCWKSG